LSEFLQHLINMLVLGGTYALLGIGLTLIFGIMNVVNFTHGVLYTFGAYIMFIVVHQLGFNFFLALPLAVVAGWLLGAAIELVLLRPLRGSDIDTTMLVMIGAWIAMQSGILWIWGGVAKAIATPFPDAPLVLGPVSVSWLRLFVLAAAALLIVATYLLINRTKLGCAMRATFQDQDTASLMGVNVDLIYTSTFAIGSRRRSPIFSKRRRRSPSPETTAMASAACRRSERSSTSLPPRSATSISRSGCRSWER